MQSPAGEPHALILLVEDDDDLRDLVGDILEGEGYEVVPARHGAQLLQYLHGSDPLPALILLDLMMPIVSGWECLRAIRADARLAALPVVLMTAHPGDRPSEADAVLRKPVRIVDLLETAARFVTTNHGTPAVH